VLRRVRAWSSLNRDSVLLKASELSSGRQLTDYQQREVLYQVYRHRKLGQADLTADDVESILEMKEDNTSRRSRKRMVSRAVSPSSEENHHPNLPPSTINQFYIKRGRGEESMRERMDPQPESQSLASPTQSPSQLDSLLQQDLRREHHEWMKQQQLTIASSTEQQVQQMRQEHEEVMAKRDEEWRALLTRMNQEHKQALDERMLAWQHSMVNALHSFRENRFTPLLQSMREEHAAAMTRWESLPR